MAVTVGIPVFNEEEILRPNTLRLVEYLRQRYDDFEVVLASNGSTDRTVELGTALAAQIPEVRFLHWPRPGVGRAFRRIAAVARYDWLVSMDMDLSVGLDFIDGGWIRGERRRELGDAIQVVAGVSLRQRVDLACRVEALQAVFADRLEHLEARPGLTLDSAD